MRIPDESGLAANGRFRGRTPDLPPTSTHPEHDCTTPAHPAGLTDELLFRYIYTSYFSGASAPAPVTPLTTPGFAPVWRKHDHCRRRRPRKHWACLRVLLGRQSNLNGVLVADGRPALHMGGEKGQPDVADAVLGGGNDKGAHLRWSACGAVLHAAGRGLSRVS